MQSSTAAGNTESAQGWHIANWGLWGWVETIIKGVGIAIGIIAFINSNSSAGLVFSGNPELGAVIVLAVISLAIIGAFFMRLRQREIISVVFAIFNVLGHVGLLIALLRVPETTTLPILFGLAFILGELTKAQFMRVSGYTEAGQSSAFMVRFALGVMFVYVVFTAFLII